MSPRSVRRVARRIRTPSPQRSFVRTRGPTASPRTCARIAATSRRRISSRSRPARARRSIWRWPARRRCVRSPNNCDRITSPLYPRNARRSRPRVVSTSPAIPRGCARRSIASSAPASESRSSSTPTAAMWISPPRSACRRSNCTPALIAMHRTMRRLSLRCATPPTTPRRSASPSMPVTDSRWRTSGPWRRSRHAKN